MIKNDILLLIPHYNNEVGLVKSLQRIDEKSIVDVLVIDDGSKNHHCFSTFNFENLNIVLLKNEVNLGITETLNNGLTYAREHGYKYIARLDAGDFQKKNRLSKQRTFLETNDLSLCGSYVKFLDENNVFLYDFKPPTEHSHIKRHLKRYNVFIHPSVMYNLNDALDVGGYPVDYQSLEDWGLFMAISKKYKVGIIPEFLVDYIVDPNSISSKKRKEQGKSKVKLLLDNFNLDFDSIFGLIKNVCIIYFPRSFLTKVKRVLIK